jgi:short-subunit dehydrogenase
MRRNIAECRGIVTGASSGIGRAIAIELARQGARVLAVARRADRLESLASEVSLSFLAGDIRNPAIRAAAIDKCQQQFGGLDFLVNAAGISSVARFAESTPERLREIMEINFFAPAEFIREVIPHLRHGQHPLIVNIGSILGHRGIPWHDDYCASKFALQGLSESLRPELAKEGIDLLVVSPGTTKTELYDADAGRATLPWKQPQGVSAEYVARKTAQAMARGKRKIIPNPQGKLLVALSRWFPSCVDWMIRRYG